MATKGQDAATQQEAVVHMNERWRQATINNLPEGGTTCGSDIREYEAEAPAGKRQWHDKWRCDNQSEEERKGSRRRLQARGGGMTSGGVTTNQRRKGKIAARVGGATRCGGAGIREALAF